MAGVSDVKEVVKVAKNEKRLTGKQTILFIDEVHRFNKMQQVFCSIIFVGQCQFDYCIPASGTSSPVNIA